MKTRFWICASILLFALAVLFGLRSARQKENLEKAQAAADPTNTIVATAGISNNPVAPVVSQINPQTSATPVIIKNGGTIDPRELQMQQGFEAKNVPINFYGLVVDQDGKPISGVQIKMNGEHVFYLISQGIASTNIGMETVTDSGGRFQWMGDSADLLAVETISKVGYLLSPQAPHSFAPSSGSLESPVIFKMWKMGEKAQLVGGSKFWGIIPDGRIYTIDLLQSTKVESTNAAGDLRISVSRPEGVSRQDHYDWSFQIVPIEGGIMETADDFMYETPENGYMPEYNFHFNKLDAPWAYRVKKSFFIKTRGGQNYGRITLEVFAHYQNQGVIDISWSVNPFGSRNLQP